MEKVRPSFQYEPLVLTPEPKTSDKEEDKGQTNGVGPLGTITKVEELTKFRGGRDNSQREVSGVKNVSE